MEALTTAIAGATTGQQQRQQHRQVLATGAGRLNRGGVGAQPQLQPQPQVQPLAPQRADTPTSGAGTNTELAQAQAQNRGVLKVSSKVPQEHQSQPAVVGPVGDIRAEILKWRLM
jgi:hypothetical protein